MNWATQFRELRGEMSQPETARALCGCPVATIRNWEQGRTIPPDWMQILIAGHLIRLQAKKKKS